GKSGRPGPGRRRKSEEKNTHAPVGKVGVANLSFSYEGMADKAKRTGPGAPRKASFDKTVAVEHVSGNSRRPGPGRRRKSEEKNTHVTAEQGGVTNLRCSYEGITGNAKRTGPGAPRKAPHDKTVAVENMSGKSGRPGPGRNRKSEEKNTHVTTEQGGVTNFFGLPSYHSRPGLPKKTRSLAQSQPRSGTLDA
ncbi:MAG: hypothetical protein HQK57_17180, partial [Deltaproteobacteria bacterium]|nr:hypothetical protein [Deltaproteobacteria bacterium]